MLILNGAARWASGPFSRKTVRRAIPTIRTQLSRFAIFCPGSSRNFQRTTGNRHGPERSKRGGEVPLAYGTDAATRQRKQDLRSHSVRSARQALGSKWGIGE